MFWNKKKKGEHRLPDLPNEPKARASMADYHSIKLAEPLAVSHPNLAQSPKQPILQRKTQKPLAPSESKEPEEHEEVNDLPSFPDSPMQKGFSQTAIKEAVETEEVKEDDLSETLESPPALSELPELPDLPDFPDSAIKEKPYIQNMPKISDIPKNPKVIELDEWKPSSSLSFDDFKMQDAPTPKPMENIPPISALPVPEHPSNRPIYIRLDKFQNARDSLSVVDEKLREIDELLRTIREVKMREDQELLSWEKEIESIKARISAVNTEIFEGSLEGY